MAPQQQSRDEDKLGVVVGTTEVEKASSSILPSSFFRFGAEITTLEATSLTTRALTTAWTEQQN